MGLGAADSAESSTSPSGADKPCEAGRLAKAKPMPDALPVMTERWPALMAGCAIAAADIAVAVVDLRVVRDGGGESQWYEDCSVRFSSPRVEYIDAKAVFAGAIWRWGFGSGDWPAHTHRFAHGGRSLGRC